MSLVLLFFLVSAVLCTLFTLSMLVFWYVLTFIISIVSELLGGIL